MKKLLVALAVLLVLFVAAVLIGPSFVDWNAYKGQIVTAVRDHTGREAAIDGDIAFSVLPTPALRVAGVRIANFDGAQAPEMLRLKELRVQVSIGALLDRRIVVEQLELIEPTIALEIAPDGKASWSFETPPGTAETESSGESEEKSEPGAPLDISLANVTLRGGSLRFHDRRSGTVEEIEKLHMTVAAPSLSGPFDVAATAEVRKIPIAVELKTGALAPGQPLTFGLKAVLTEADATLHFNGRMLAPVPTGLISGKLEIEGSNAAQLAALAGQKNIPPALAQPVSLNGMLMVSPDAVALNDSAIKFGPISGNGAVSVTLGKTVKADVAVSISRLNLDELLAQVRASDKPPAQDKPAAEKAKAAGTPTNVAAFELPRNVNATFDLAVDVAQYRDGVVREIGVRAALANGAVTLDRATALLPGGSDISLFGFLSVVEGTPRFEGDITVNSDNLRALLDWAGADTNALPPDRLRNFSYASKVKLTPDAMEVPDINIQLDASTMTGGLAVALRERPGFGLRLAVDRLNLDAYLPRPAKAAAGRSGDKAAGTGAAATKGNGAKPLAFLNSFDADIDARVERLTVQKAPAHKVHFDGLLVGGALTVRKASIAEFAGTAASVSGAVSDLAATPSVKLDYRVAVNDPDKLFRFLGQSPPVPIRKLGKPTAEGHLEGSIADVKVKSLLAAAGIKIQVDGTVKDAAGVPTFDMGVAVNHPEMTELVRLTAPEFHPAAKTLGPVAAAFRVSGSPADLKISALDATAGPLRIKGEMAVRTDGPRPSVRADLSTSELLLDLFQPPQKKTDTATERGRAATAGTNGTAAPSERWSRALIDLSALRALDADVNLRMAALTSDRIRLTEPAIQAVLTNGQLDLKQFTANLFGGALAAKGKLDAAAAVPTVSADVSASNVDLATILKTFAETVRATGPVSANAKLTTAGNSVAAFVSALSGQANLAGRVQLIATQKEEQLAGAVGLAAVLFGDKVKELKQAGDLTNELMQAFGRAPADLSGNFTIDRGVARTNDTVLNGAGARALTAGAVDLPRWLIDTATSVRRSGRDTQEPFISVALSGPLDDPNPKFGGSILSLRSKSSEPSNPLQQILPGVLGKQSESGKTEKVEPKDIIRGLLKGLGK